MQLTDEQAIELGTRAGALLKSQTFNMIVSQLHTQYVDNIMNSQPHEKMVREDNYNLDRALQHIVSTLAGYANAKDEVVARLDAEEAQEKEQ